MRSPVDNSTRAEEAITVRWRVDVTEFGKSQSYAVYTWLRTICVHIIPLVLLCVINFYLIKFIRLANSRWRLLRRGVKSAKQSVGSSANAGGTLACTTAQTGVTNAATLASTRRSERRQAAQRKLTVLLVAIVGLFLAGQIPQAFAYVSNYQVVLRLFGRTANSLACWPPYRLYRAITNCICLITYSANFFLYATLNSHFKRQLDRWIEMCNLRRKYLHPTKCSNVLESGRYATVEQTNRCLHLTESLSADAYRVKHRRAPRQAALESSNEAVPATDPNAVYDSPDRLAFSTYSDHVWRVSIAVIPQAGGRPVALANATMGRSITPMQSPSSSSHEFLRESQRSALGLPTNQASASGKVITPISPGEPHRPRLRPRASTREDADSVANSQSLLKQAREDLATAPNEKLLVRVHSHSKRFWTKRRRLLAETRGKVKYAKRRATWTGRPLTGSQFQLHVTSQRLHDVGRQYRENNLRLLLPSCLTSKSWCPPFVVASILRANRDAKNASTQFIRHTLPLAYQETHLDNLL